MTSHQWRAVCDLFEAVVDLPSPDVDPWLASQQAEPEVLREVRALLATHARAGAFLDEPLATRVPSLVEDAGRFAPGDAVGRYVVQREVGRGGMGRVYLATDTRLGRDVALKVLAPHLVRDEGQRERLRREARAAAVLNHPGICTIYELEEVGHDVVLASEFVEGETLRAEIERAVRPSAQDVEMVARALASTLEAAHARGITHRDLKPENIMRARSGALKVLDFGLALVDTEASALDAPRVTTPGMLVGTPAYMAPEQLDRGVVGPATDQFALGVVLYEFATGTHPFASATPLARLARILEGEHAPLQSLRPDLSPALVAVVERCLQKAPTARFANVADLLRALDMPTATGSEPGRQPSAEAWWRTHLRVVLALYVVAAAASWMAKEWEEGLVEPLFILVALLVVVGGMYRSHLLFADSVLDRQAFRRALARARMPLTVVDVMLGLALAVQGTLVATARAVPGVLIVGLAAGLVLARLVLERSTTEAAFGEP